MLLPSRGGSASRPLSALRQSFTYARQTAVSRQPANRQFSQLQRLTRSSPQPSPASAALRGHSSALPRLSAISRNSIRQGITLGASRPLSLWPFGASQQPTEPNTSREITTTSATSPPQSSIGTSSSSAESQIPGQAPISEGAFPAGSGLPNVPAATYADPISSSIGSDSFGDFEALESSSILDIPEQIGYLKHLGLDFGWGPSAMCEWYLEHIYIYTGLPWWAAIALAAVGGRIAAFYPAVVGARQSAKLAILKQDPEYNRVTAEAKQIMWDKDVDQMVKMKAQAKVQMINKRAGVSMLKTLIPPLAIVPFSYGMFRVLRGMSALPVPSLEASGLLWIKDLTVYDPTYILPLASAALSALSMKQLQKTNMNSTPEAESMQKFMLYGLTPFMFVVTMWFPAAVQWFFFIFAVSTVVQGAALANPAIRRLVQLPPLLGKHITASAAKPQYQAPSRGGVRGILDGANKNFSSLQKGIEDYTGGPAKAAAKKAQAYEKKRAQEEKDKAMHRLLEMQRRKMSGRD